MKCLICGSSSKLVLKRMNGYVKDSYYNIYECPSCKLSFSDPLRTDNFVYESIYKNSKKIPGYSRYYKYSKNIKNKKKPLDWLASKEPAYWSVKKVLNTISSQKENVKILEIGGGLGYLTYALNQDGYNCLGVDISKDAVEKAKKNFGEYYKHINIFNNNLGHKFDLIIMTEVLEHVENPINLVKKTKELLKNDGKMLITTPNKFFEFKNAVWVSDHPPVHLFSFSKKSLEEIGKLLRLKTGFVDFSEFNKNNRVYLSNNPNRRSHLNFLKRKKPFLDENGNFKQGFLSYLTSLTKNITPIRLKVLIKNVFSKKGVSLYQGNDSYTLSVIYKK